MMSCRKFTLRNILGTRWRALTKCFITSNYRYFIIPRGGGNGLIKNCLLVIQGYDVSMLPGKMKHYPSEIPDSGWVRPTIVFMDNNDRYVRQWLLDCEKYSVQSVNNEEKPDYPPASQSGSSEIYCEVADIATDDRKEIQRWSTWRIKVNEQLINNVLVVDQLYAEMDSDVKEDVPSSANCFQEASKSMRKSSTDLSLPDFTVYGIPRVRLGK